MLSRLSLTASRLTRNLRSQSVRHASDSYSAGDLVKPTMNDLPVPSGSWQTGFDKKKQRFNMQLIGSILFFAATSAYFFGQEFVWAGMPPPMKNKK